MVFPASSWSTLAHKDLISHEIALVMLSIQSSNWSNYVISVHSYAPEVEVIACVLVY